MPITKRRSTAFRWSWRSISSLFSPKPGRSSSTAESYRAWGRSLLAQSDRSPPEQAQRLLHEGREQLRRAGITFARLAALRTTGKEYPEDLWASGQCAMEGQDYPGAVDVFQRYLKTGTQDRNGRVLVDLGDACLALGRANEAIRWFDECVRSHPRDAASYRAAGRNPGPVGTGGDGQSRAALAGGAGR